MKQSATTKAALPEMPERLKQCPALAKRLREDKDNMDYFVADCKDAWIAAELVLRYNAHEQMRGGLQKAIALLESSAHAQHHIQCPAHECEPLGGKDCVCVDEIQPLRNALAQLERPA